MAERRKRSQTPDTKGTDDSAKGREWGRVAVVTRVGGVPHVRFFTCWTGLVWRGVRRGDFVMAPVIRQPPHRAINSAVRAFLEEEPLQNCDTICFVDDDHTFSWDTLERLRTNPAGMAYDMLGALYAARGANVGGGWPVILRVGTVNEQTGAPKYKLPKEYQPGEVMWADAIGFGFTLIRRSMLERMKGPYAFYREPDYTEDVLFCEQVKKLGGTIGVDTSVTIGHLEDMITVPSLDKDGAKNEFRTAMAGKRPGTKGLPGGAGGSGPDGGTVGS